MLLNRFWLLSKAAERVNRIYKHKKNFDNKVFPAICNRYVLHFQPMEIEMGFQNSKLKVKNSFSLMSIYPFSFIYNC